MDQNQPNQINTQDIQRIIAAALNITDLSDQKQKEIIEKATEILLKKIFLETIGNLSEEDAKTYAELLEKKTALEEIEKFLNAKIPNRAQVTQKTINDFITGMTSAAAIA